LQGIKRGIVEMADAIVINKADGKNQQAAQRAQSDYQNALHLFPPTESGWTPPVLTCSALTGDGIAEVWDTVERYRAHAESTGYLQTRRQRQARYWMHQTIEHQLKADFFGDPNIQAAIDGIESDVLEGTMSSFAAAERLIQIYRRSDS
jgi:LAO/AO transport system kinase